MEKLTMKERRADVKYIHTFQKCGNAKLKDYTDPRSGRAYKYAMFNLPAKKTCPFATEGCKKFCYAKRDERYPEARANRNSNFGYSLAPEFSKNLEYTIETELDSKRYKDSVMIVRIHESGDFYNIKYLEKWIDAIGHFTGRENAVNFCFYTKCFKYLLKLDARRAGILNKALESGLVAMSLSYDETMSKEQTADLYLAKAKYPLANIYAAIPENHMNSFKYDEKCDCADCAKCGHCTHATGKITACAIH